MLGRHVWKGRPEGQTPQKLIADGVSLAKTADEKSGECHDPEGTEVLHHKMATNAYFPPYEYYDGDTIVGIDAEVAQAIADKLGMTLEIKDIEFDSIITGVQSGKFDMGMAGMTVTEERKQSVDFSDSYATGIQSIIVPEDSAIKSIDDIRRRRNVQGRRSAFDHRRYLHLPMTSATELRIWSLSIRPVTTP